MPGQADLSRHPKAKEAFLAAAQEWELLEMEIRDIESARAFGRRASERRLLAGTDAAAGQTAKPICNKAEKSPSGQAFDESSFLEKGLQRWTLRKNL